MTVRARSLRSHQLAPCGRGRDHCYLNRFHHVEIELLRRAGQRPLDQCREITHAGVVARRHRALVGGLAGGSSLSVSWVRAVPLVVWQVSSPLRVISISTM